MLKVLVTRPEPKCSQLVQLLNAEGFAAEALPVLEVIYQMDSTAHQKIQQIGQDDMLIFVSENAVHGLFHGVALTDIAPLFSHRVFAVGKASAQLLRQKGFQRVSYPEDEQNSEGLLRLLVEDNVLDHPSSAHLFQKVSIFRGQEGRELIYKTLQQRGLSVDYISTYVTQLPQDAKAQFKALWQAHHFDIVVTTSLQGLRNFLSLLEAAPDLRKTALTAMRGNMLNLVQALGAHSIILERADNVSICKQLKEWAHE